MFKQTLAGLSLALFGTVAAAQSFQDYEITISNLTPGQTFTPQLIVTHSRHYRMFTPGQPASEALEILAEGGATGPLTDESANQATDALTVPGLLGPGQTVTAVVRGRPGRRISVAAMLIPTNDTFMALNAVPLTFGRQAAEYYVPAYDAGTETNDQSCQHIPGPRCDGEGYVAGGGEGVVHIGNGFHELGEVDDDGYEVLGPQVYDWRNSVARIVVRRLQP